MKKWSHLNESNLSVLYCVSHTKILLRMDENGNLNVLLIVALVLLGAYNARRQPVAQHDSILTGDLYYQEIMATINVSRFLQIARMDKQTFVKLKELLMNVGGLEDSMYICAGQKLMILLYVVRGHTNRETAERWQHSGATISAIVHVVSDCLIGAKQVIYRPAKEGDPVPSQIANVAKFAPYFNDCVNMCSRP